jgi:hypothetical protein
MHNSVGFSKPTPFFPIVSVLAKSTLLKKEEMSVLLNLGVAIRVGVSGSGPTRLRPDMIIFDMTRHD